MGNGLPLVRQSRYSGRMPNMGSGTGSQGSSHFSKAPGPGGNSVGQPGGPPGPGPGPAGGSGPGKAGGRGPGATPGYPGAGATGTGSGTGGVPPWFQGY